MTGRGMLSFIRYSCSRKRVNYAKDLIHSVIDQPSCEGKASSSLLTIASAVFRTAASDILCCASDDSDAAQLGTSHDVRLKAMCSRIGYRCSMELVEDRK